MDVFANPEAKELNPDEALKKFGNWLRFKKEAEDLAEFEKKLLDTPGERFLEHLERELNPSRSYKMVVLLSLLSTKTKQTSWTITEIARRFLDFYLNNPVYISDYKALSREADPSKYPIQKVEKHIIDKPIKRLSKPKNDCFIYDKNKQIFLIKKEYIPYWTNVEYRKLAKDRVIFKLKWHMKDKI
ncbi:MAG: hypothetical protein GF364_06640 [Candidatus Lokiarchaeota archaeon]|nr:hypothetical protein [Candidatus Lokiarchaeota archaeon]